MEEGAFMLFCIAYEGCDFICIEQGIGKAFGPRK